MESSSSDVPQLQPANPAPSEDLTPAQPSALIASTSASSSKSLPEHLMQKNRLQEYAQKSNILLPIYQTINEGFQHAPKFRSSVLVDGVCYTSPNTFTCRKAAEQDVARLAMQSIAQKIKDEGCPLIYEDTVLCKLILNEYAVKRSIEKPTYNTVQPEGLLQIFISYLVFNGVSYTGDAGKSKKEAEQLAARAAILSLLGDPESETILSEIIKSKYKLYASLHKVKDTHSAPASLVPPAENTGHSSMILTNAPMAAVPQASFGMHPPHHEFVKRKPEEPASQATPLLPITFVRSVCEQPLGVVSNALGVVSTSKKRRKNKKKANKKLHTDAQLPVAALPSNQPSPCPVAQ